MSAQEIVDDPGIAIDPITRARGYTEDEIRHFQIGAEDMERIAFKIVNPNAPGRKKTKTVNIRPTVTECIIEDAIDATPSFVVTVHDPEWDLLNSGGLDHTIDINPGGIPHRWYRLNAIEVNDADITLTFLTRNAMYLSYHTRPYKVSRNHMTRAQFILTMLHHVKKKGVKIKLYCPELTKRQPIASAGDASIGAAGQSGSDSPSGPVISEGDSLAVGTSGKLNSPGGTVTTRAAVGRTSSQGVSDLTGVSLPATLVVQLGTNDTDVSTFRGNIRDILAMDGVKRVYWVNISRPILGGVTDTDLNKVLNEQANSSSKLDIIDWKGAVTDGRAAMSGDNIHPTAAGYDYRATLINAALKGSAVASISSVEKPVSDKKAAEQRQGGIDGGSHLKVNTGVGTPVEADSEQLRVGEEVLQEGSRMGGPPRALVGGMMVAMVESSLRESATNGQFVGVFQQSSQYGWPATRDTTKDARGFFAKYIPAVRADPNGDLAQLAQKVQGAFGPGNESYFGKLNKARPDAEKWVKEFTGGTTIGAGAENTSYAKSYEFMIGEPDGPKGENYLAATYRLAEEVNWRAFWVRDVLHYMSEEDLFKSKARARIRYHALGSEGTTKGKQVSAVADSVQATWDRGKRVQSITLSIHMERWVAPVGTVVIFDEGGPLQGRWLVTNIRRSVFDTLGEITLMQPMKEKKEPKHDIKQRPTSGGDTTPSNLADVDGSPKDIIDNVVIPMALAISDKFVSGGVTKRLSPASVEAANATHGATTGGGRSDHQGPPQFAWAADMSDNWGSTSGSDNMTELAKSLKEQFNLPSYKGGCFSHSTKRYRFQICYLTTTGGNHFNHVHFGVKDLNASPNTPI